MRGGAGATSSSSSLAPARNVAITATNQLRAAGRVRLCAHMHTAQPHATASQPRGRRCEGAPWGSSSAGPHTGPKDRVGAAGSPQTVSSTAPLQLLTCRQLRPTRAGRVRSHR
jgi:hypothetical protein